MVKRILVGLGGTPYTRVAVKRAIELAGIHASSLTGVTVIDRRRLQKVGPVPPGAGPFAKRLSEQRLALTRERVEAAVDAFREACTSAGVAHTVEIETGDPFSLMISHSRYHDLTVFGLRSLFDYGFTPEPKDALVRLVSKGVRPILAVSERYRPVRRALVAYSGSMESAKAMRRFVQMRLWPDTRLDIVHFSSDPARDPAMLSQAAAYCRSHGFPTDTHLSEDRPVSGILSRARTLESDIVVMGNSIRSLFARQVLGSALISTLQNADRPLFLAQ